MAKPNLLDIKPDTTPKPVHPASLPIVNKPESTNKQPTGIRDWKGEEWSLDSAMGRMLENTALQNGVKPNYVYNTTQTMLPSNVIESGSINIIPKEKRQKSEIANQSENVATPDSFYQQGLSPIKAMQQALINISQDISSHNIHSVSDRYSKEDEGSRDLLTGANAFMNFMVNNYMNKAKTTGKQLVNTDIRQPTRMDTAKPNDNFKGVLDTIQRIGTPGQEHKPDGNWGSRTNNALKQVYSLAHALMGVINDMGLQLDSYTDKDLEELYNLIPPDITKVSINEKVQKAGIIAKNLDKLRGLYDTFRESILNNKTYRAHIVQEKPLTISKQQTTVPSLSDYEKSLYEKYKATEIDATLNGKKITVMPYNLTSMDNFKKFLNSKKNILTQEELVAVNNNDQQTINKFLIEIATGLEQ